MYPIISAISAALVGFRSFAKPIVYVNVHSDHTSEKRKNIDIANVVLGKNRRLKDLTRMFSPILIVGGINGMVDPTKSLVVFSVFL